MILDHTTEYIPMQERTPHFGHFLSSNSHKIQETRASINSVYLCGCRHFAVPGSHMAGQDWLKLHFNHFLKRLICFTFVMEKDSADQNNRLGASLLGENVAILYF